MATMLDAMQNNQGENADNTFQPVRDTGDVRTDTVDLDQNEPEIGLQDDPDALTTEQTIRNDATTAEIAGIEQDVQDDLYNRDGDTNDSELAGQRLAAISGRLTGAFAQAASGLSIMISAAILKKEVADKDETLINFQNQQEQKKEKDAEAASDEASEISGDIQKQQQKEREEWAQAQHSYAGIEMTGEEWGEFSDKLKGDTPLRKWLLEKLKKQGKTDAQANEMADQMSLLAKMQSLPPSQWTPEMKALDTKLDADPTLKKELERNLQETKKAEAIVEVNNQRVVANLEIAATGTETSIAAKADILAQSAGPEAALTTIPTYKATSEEERTFPTAPDLGEHHRAAMEAKVPLDTSKQLASFIPPPTPATPAPGGGFDV